MRWKRIMGVQLKAMQSQGAKEVANSKRVREN
jgi:hypothetical protein